MIIELILIYLTYLIILILGSYYVNLYLSKDQFTKEELKNIFPFLAQFWNRILSNFSIFLVAIILFISSLLGILIIMLSEHWFLNSAIVFIIVFLTFPLVKKNFAKVMVTTGAGFSDTVINIFSKYYNFMLLGFGTGTGAGLMYNWGVYKTVPFLWFLINFTVISILCGIVIYNVYNQ